MALVRHEGQWSLLPTNLWAEISSRRHPSNYHHGIAGCNEDWISYGTKEQSDFFRLRTVCQIFNTTFRLHKNLCSSVIIESDSQSCQLPSLVKWLRCYHSHVKRLRVSHGIPRLETALVALHSPHSCLEVVHNYNTVPDTAIFLLSTFQSIKTCTLHSNQSSSTFTCTLHSSLTGSVNLQPLSSLPLLTTLVLRLRSFQILAQHLT